MKKAVKIGLFFVFITSIGAGIWLIYAFGPATNPLPLGATPTIQLPYIDDTNLHYIGGFGQVSPSYYHNGIDFGFNGTTTIVAPCTALITNVHFWFNDKGGHWQTNIGLRLNQEWSIEVIFESWALTQEQGQQQANAITANIGTIVNKNQSLGQLLSQGDGSHVHFGIKGSGGDLCPYLYWTPTAKTTFDIQFAILNRSLAPCM